MKRDLVFKRGIWEVALGMAFLKYPQSGMQKLMGEKKYRLSAGYLLPKLQEIESGFLRPAAVCTYMCCSTLQNKKDN